MKRKSISIIQKNLLPVLLTFCLLLCQLLGYYLAKLTPFDAHIVGNSIDNSIPFIPAFVIPYVFWYLFLVLVPCYCYSQSREDFYCYIVTNFFINMVAILIFLFYPTLINRPEFTADSIFTGILKIVYLSDTPALNCFPSIHCANCFSAIITMIKSSKIKKSSKTIIIFTAITIILSTLFIKQHALVDVVGAFILSIMVAFVVRKFSIYSYVQDWIERKK